MSAAARIRNQLAVAISQHIVIARIAQNPSRNAALARPLATRLT